jgi:hypothetical protein
MQKLKQYMQNHDAITLCESFDKDHTENLD